MLKASKAAVMGKGFYVILCGAALALSGCVVRTYPLTRDRVDQDISGSSGNRGYLMGNAPAGEQKDRPTTRTTQVVEIELHSPIKFDKMHKKERAASAAQDTSASSVPAYGTDYTVSQPVESAVSSQGPSEQYTVQKGDTLQKISQKFYGTTKNWMKLYNANRDRLKGPDKVRPGQVLDIPSLPGMKSGAEPLNEPRENLK